MSMHIMHCDMRPSWSCSNVRSISALVMGKDEASWSHGVSSSTSQSSGSTQESMSWSVTTISVKTVCVKEYRHQPRKCITSFHWHRRTSLTQASHSMKRISSVFAENVTGQGTERENADTRWMSSAESPPNRSPYCGKLPIGHGDRAVELFFR